jgi:hypothetical protein
MKFTLNGKEHGRKTTQTITTQTHAAANTAHPAGGNS